MCTPYAKIASKYTFPHKRTKTMVELKDQIEKLEKDIKALATNQKLWKEEMKNNNAVLKKEIKDEVILVLERRLDENLDIINKKQKDLMKK